MKGVLVPLVFFLSCAAAIAQQTATPAASSGIAIDVRTPQITPKSGQTSQQLWTDRYECDRWAVDQSGFDPAKAGSAGAGSAASRDQYRRAFDACLTGRGYDVRYAAPQMPPPPPPPVVEQHLYVRQPVVVDYPELGYHPFSAHIDGGYSVATGVTSDGLDDGANVGLGATWFPIEALPVGLRIDGSYSWFDLKHPPVLAEGPTLTNGHEHIYGGDADLQFDLAHHSSRFKFYLFGGAGWYREQTDIRTLQFDDGPVCEGFYCQHGPFPTAAVWSRTTSPWRDSWNAGLGFETAVAERTSFFIEARYLRIGPQSDRMQFVPIRLGLRF